MSNNKPKSRRIVSSSCSGTVEIIPPVLEDNVGEYIMKQLHVK